MQKIISFYKFLKIDNPKQEVAEIKALIVANYPSIKGSILIAAEGLNATVCGIESEINTFFEFLDDRFLLGDCNLKEDYGKEPILKKLKVLLKKEIITIKNSKADPIANTVGKYLTPEEWHEMLIRSDKENLAVIDTRNEYEVSHGTFKGAVDPKIDNFSEFTQFIDNNISNFQNKKVAMFCTGGIRCEKATAYAINAGIKEVYHLKGGIINYIKKFAKNPESVWQGDCFVFDERVTYK